MTDACDEDWTLTNQERVKVMTAVSFLIFFPLKKKIGAIVPYRTMQLILAYILFHRGYTYIWFKIAFKINQTRVYILGQMLLEFSSLTQWIPLMSTGIAIYLRWRGYDLLCPFKLYKKAERDGTEFLVTSDTNQGVKLSSLSLPIVPVLG